MSGVFFPSDYSVVLVGLAATLISVLVASVSVFLKGNSQANPDSARPSEDGYLGAIKELPDRVNNWINRGNWSERQVGASMLEQLAPDLMDHVLSYLDYQSLCCLSMTNSHMQKAADDEAVWKRIYYKDFEPEESYITPPNGWKAYYATTKAVFCANTEFFSIAKGGLSLAMRRIWLKADYVKCVHERGVQSVGYESVLQSWRVLFSCVQIPDFGISHVRARIVGDTAWVTMKIFFRLPLPPFNVTNVFELHDGRWYVVLHHCSRTRQFQGW